MAITNRDYIVKLHTSYGVPCLNVFFYRAAVAYAPGRAAQLASIFNSTVANELANIMVTAVTVGRITVENLVELTDYAEQESTATNGALTPTSPAPTFTAYNFQLVRSTREGRHGYKRIVGVAEELVSYGTATVSGALVTAIPDAVAALGATISTGGVDFTPMIPHRVLTTMPDGEKKYLLNELFGIGSVIFRGLTTQNTRKSL